MNDISNISRIASVVSLIISIIFIVRWWGMTSDIKDIRNYLYKKDIVEIESPIYDPQIEFDADVEKLKLKMKPNQCIVKVLANSLLEIWPKETWDEHIAAGKGKYFKQIYKNY